MNSIAYIIVDCKNCLFVLTSNARLMQSFPMHAVIRAGVLLELCWLSKQIKQLELHKDDCFSFQVWWHCYSFLKNKNPWSQHEKGFVEIQRKGARGCWLFRTEVICSHTVWKILKTFAVFVKGEKHKKRKKKNNKKQWRIKRRTTDKPRSNCAGETVFPCLAFLFCGHFLFLRLFKQRKGP